MDEDNVRRAPLFTGRGDSGVTSDIFGCKIPKGGLLAELFVKMDFLQAAIDEMIFDSSVIQEDRDILEKVQKNLWQSYAMIQDPENKRGFVTSPVNEDDLKSVENYINESQKYSPRGFIRFKTSKGQHLNYCRVCARNLEISLHRFLEKEQKEIDKVLLAYFNRLSSFFFAMALRKEFAD